jgi:hypothetical protein
MNRMAAAALLMAGHSFQSWLLSADGLVRMISTASSPSAASAATST